MITRFTTFLLIVFTLTIVPTQSWGQSEDVSLGHSLLVLHDGRILEGKITALKRGYRIDRSSGQTTVPFSHVVCHAKTLREAYRKQREGMTRPTATQHVGLAKWCLQQELFAEAERELESALSLQPHHGEAKRLLLKFDQRKPKDSAYENNKWKKTFDQMLIDQAFNPVEPIGGLESELAKEFTTAIEPLLLNSCSSGGCHGQLSKSDFRLTPKWNLSGNTRHITDQNLRAVLEQIDSHNPDASPLIAKLDGHHGARKTDVFRGANAVVLRQRLELWTLRVARSQAPPAPEVTTADMKSTLDQFTTSAEIRESPIMPANFEQSAQPVTNPLKAVRAEQAHDPFNPAVFNRKVHGRD